MPGMRLVCRSAHGHFPRKGQRRRSLTVWKAETSGADCLGARGTALHRPKEENAIYFSTKYPDSASREVREVNCDLFQHQGSGQFPAGSVSAPEPWTAPPASQSAGITGMSHRAWPKSGIFNSLECTHPTSTQSSPQLTLPSSASSVSSRGMMLIASPFPT
ncbi:uncharacterized protein [Symphalangus syndactylus]|uniref:uncharacterized protein isoform X2 n=1 Tax=Symphalangus syndactylus TaxID=9590 RepID=UPI003007104B